MKKILLAIVFILLWGFSPWYGLPYVTNEFIIHDHKNILQDISEKLGAEAIDTQEYFSVLGGSGNYCELGLFYLVKKEGLFSGIDSLNNNREGAFVPIRPFEGGYEFDSQYDDILREMLDATYIDDDLNLFLTREYNNDFSYGLLFVWDSWEDGIGVRDIRCH